MVGLLRHTSSINLFEPNNREQHNSLQERLQVLKSHTNQAFSPCFLPSLCLRTLPVIQTDQRHLGKNTFHFSFL